MPLSRPLRRTPGKRRALTALVFLGAFLLFVALFGGMMLWAYITFLRETGETEGTAPSGTAPEPVSYTDADARGLLLIIEDGGEAQGFVMVLAEPAQGRMRAVAVPRETVVDIGTAQRRLCDVYGGANGAELRDLLAARTGLPLQNYAVITYRNIERVVGYFVDGLDFRVPEKLDYAAPDGSWSVRLEARTYKLTPAQLTGLLRYPRWSGGRRQQAEVQAAVVAALINQYCVPARQAQGPDDFTALVNLVRADLLVPQYQQYRETLDYLAGRNTEGALCAASCAPGTFVGTGDALRFELDDAP